VGTGDPADNSPSERAVAARLAAIVESSFDAIVAKDLNSIITDWNPAAERMFGYTAEEAVGKSIKMLIPPELQDEEDDIIRRIRANERVDSFETVRLRKDGTRIHVSMTVSPIRDPDGRVVGASKIARDITETRENERRIRLLLREINHRVKNQYAVILSMIRETGQRSDSIEEFQAKIRTRIAGLAASNDLLVRTQWSGSTLAEVIAEHLAPFGHEDVVSVNGPLLFIGAPAVQNIGLAFHELGTNSAKYGVLSGRSGSVSIDWSIDNSLPEPEVTLTWDERFDDPLEEEPGNGAGFGSVVLQRIAPMSLSGRATTSRELSGVRWALVAPLSAFRVEAEES
jgi:PAS domain S-box-containing protein